MLEYSDDEINREIFRTQAWHGLGRKGINDFFFSEKKRVEEPNDAERTLTSLVLQE